MKKLVTIIAVMFVSFNVIAQGDDVPVKEVILNVSDVYVPSGFDSDSDAYVVINGLYPNTCYNFKRADVAHKSVTEHEIVAVADVKQAVCIRVFVPFTQEVSLGQLAQGEHTIRFVFDDGTSLEKTLTIE